MTFTRNFFISFIILSIGLYYFFASFFNHIWLLFVITALISLILAVFSTENINGVKSDVIGDGQYGKARFATKKEIKSYYEIVSEKEAFNPGIVVGRTSKHNGKYIVDTGDNSMTLLAPPGMGKTKFLLIPTLAYNAYVNRNTKGSGASFIVTDLKGEEYETISDEMRNCGYKTPVLDFSNPLASENYNIMYKINDYIDIYKKSNIKTEKAQSYARAERYAKVLAASIVENVDTNNKSEAGQFFTETAKGLVTGIVLFVSEYCDDDARHILSVFNLIIELNGLDEENSTNDLQVSKLSKLLENVENKRIIKYVGPAMSADNRTSMNVFSSALAKLVSFIDAEFEQMICTHSKDFNDIDFIENPTAVFIICPDENTDRHFFASLFIRFLMNDLIEIARLNNQTLPRKVIVIGDEFGNMPYIKDFDVLLTAIRSRGIRFVLALQSFSQLEKNYTKTMSEIVFDASQCIVFTGQATSSEHTNKRLSEMLGTQTIQSATQNKTSAIGGEVSLQMISRPLMFPSEVALMPKEQFICSKIGQYPVKMYAPYFGYYIKNLKDTKYNNVAVFKEIKTATLADFDTFKKQTIKFKIGMFD